MDTVKGILIAAAGFIVGSIALAGGAKAVSAIKSKLGK